VGDPDVVWLHFAVEGIAAQLAQISILQDRLAVRARISGP